ncbi:MAG: hypothetical protein ABR543_12995 [Gemmatimonadaceae bacterium]
MRKFVVRLAVLAVVMGTIACNDKGPSAPQLLLRAALNGSYTCAESFFHYAGPQGLGFYLGSCQNYLSATNPNRADSAETKPFTILQNNTFSRLDFPAGTVQYDSTTQVVRVTFPDRPAENYVAAVETGRLVLSQRYPAFDFSGDGIADTLIVRFTKDP